MAAGWFYSPQQIKKYLLTRPSSLKPPKTTLRNPVSILKELDKHQWLLFAVGFTAWTWDAFDFFTVALCVTEIAKDFGKENSAVTVSCLIHVAYVHGGRQETDNAIPAHQSHLVFS